MFPHSNLFGPLFWIIMGFIYVLIFISTKYWLNDLNIKLSWWKRLILVAWFILLNITIAAGLTLIGEDEKRAGIYFLVFFGVICIIGGVASWRMIMPSKQKK